MIGNVFTSSFKDVWFNSRHTDVLNSILLSDCAKIDCRFAYYNTEMKEVLEQNKYDISFI